MNDSEIIMLLFNRDESAIKSIQDKYYNYCHYISFNILHSEEDVKECINETLHAIWSSIPPHYPDNLKVYIGKIAREVSISAYRKNHAAKRTPDGSISSIEEIEELLPADELGDRLEQEELSKALSTFLRSIPIESRNIMIRRYWYNDSIKDICERFGCGESKVKITLKRSRDKLKKYLKEEGYLE